MRASSCQAEFRAAGRMPRRPEQPGAHISSGVVGRSERAVPRSSLRVPGLGDIDSARGDTAFGERHRSHDGDTCVPRRNGWWCRPWGGAAGEQDGQILATVTARRTRSPHRRIVPFVDEDHGNQAGKGIRVARSTDKCLQVSRFRTRCTRRRAVSILPAYLGSSIAMAGTSGRPCVRKTIQGPAPYFGPAIQNADSYWSKRRTWQVGTSGGDPRPPRRCGFAMRPLRPSATDTTR